MEDFNTVFLKTIDLLINRKLSSSKFDRTFASVIHGINDDGTYKIAYENKLYDVPNGLGIDLEVMQSVWVTMPNGSKKLKDMYISAIRGKLKK